MATKRKSKSKTLTAKKELRAVDRTAWNGDLDDDELVRRGGALMAMLAGRARQLGHSRTELAVHLGVTYGYIAQLSGGHRHPEFISEEFSKDCARYLGIPRIMVLMAAGVLSPLDVFERPDEIASALPRAMACIQEDPYFGPMMPPELMTTSVSSRLQFFVVMLFNMARQCKLIPGEYSLEQAAQSLKGIELHRKELVKKVKTA